SLNWNTTSGPDGGATIQVVVEDMAGNTTTSAVRNVSVDNVSPTPTLADPGQSLSGIVSLSATSDPDTTQVDFERRHAGSGSWVTVGCTRVALSGAYSDAGSGVASVRYELRPTGGGSWTTIATGSSAPFNASWDASTTASGSYDLRPVITDNAGNTFTGALI